MTMAEAIAQQPAWVGIWLIWLNVAVLVLPLLLFIWRETRLVPPVIWAVYLVAGAGIGWLYGQMGYVKLLGLPHLLFWTPALIWLAVLIRRARTPVWARRVLIVIAASMAVSLAFDLVDVLRWIAGDRVAFPGTI